MHSASKRRRINGPRRSIQHQIKPRWLIGTVHRPQFRYCSQQRLGIRVLRIFKQRNHRILFNDLTITHHHHAIGNLCNNPHIVGDKDHPHIHLFL